MVNDEVINLCMEEEIKKRHSTDYVLEGSLNLDLEILAPAGEKSDRESETDGEPETEKIPSR